MLQASARFSICTERQSGRAAADQEVLTAVHESYDVSNHSSTATLPVEFVDRYAIVGPPEECIRRIQQVIDLGIERLVLFGPTVDAVNGDNKLAADLMVREVLPAFSR